jgi:hypothetical protein
MAENSSHPLCGWWLIRFGLMRAKALQTVIRLERDTSRRFAAAESNVFAMITTQRMLTLGDDHVKSLISQSTHHVQE